MRTLPVCLTRCAYPHEMSKMVSPAEEALAMGLYHVSMCRHRDRLIGRADGPMDFTGVSLPSKHAHKAWRGP